MLMRMVMIMKVSLAVLFRTLADGTVAVYVVSGGDA
jgi:hypothetical protein